MKFESAFKALVYYRTRRPGLSAPASVRPARRESSHAQVRNLAEDRLEPMLTLSLCLDALRPGERKALERLLAHPDLPLAEVARMYRTRPDLLRRRRKQGLERLTRELQRRGLM
ncbi:MAG: hypothetical protein SV487_01380 [Thermodesulfobacteriota bacterium]|nr:hypothetical protein [Thermodesulfobacteriota bacterium]